MKRKPIFEMGFKPENLYHPFTKRHIGFYIHDEHSIEKYSQFSLEDVDLFYQPVEDPVDGIIYFVLGLIILVIGETLQLKLLKSVKKENGLVNEVTQIYSISTMIMGPILFVVVHSTDFVHPLNEVFGQWFCSMGRLLGYLNINIVIFHSFFVALMRYFFIIHQDSVQKYGKEKIKRFFTILSLLIPVVMVTWGVIENSELDALLYIDRCYGIDHKVFMAENDLLHRFDCVFEPSDAEGMYGWFLDTLSQSICLLRGMITLLMGFNFSEGLLYIKIIRHIKRLVISFEVNCIC